MFEAMANFLIHEEIANTEGRCIVLLPDFDFFFLIFFFFLLLQYSYCGKTFCSVFMSCFQCKLSVLVTKHILLYSVVLCSLRQMQEQVSQIKRHPFKYMVS